MKGCVEKGECGYTPRPEEDEKLASLCKALGHPHRVHILRFLLSSDSCYAGEIAEELPVAASTVSQHLSQMKAAGIIKGEVEGLRRCYYVDPDVLGTLKTLIAAL